MSCLVNAVKGNRFERYAALRCLLLTNVYDVESIGRKSGPSEYRSDRLACVRDVHGSLQSHGEHAPSPQFSLCGTVRMHFPGRLFRNPVPARKPPLATVCSWPAAVANPWLPAYHARCRRKGVTAALRG